MKATKKLRAVSVCAAVVGMCVIGGTLTGFSADAETVNATDAVAAVQRVAPEAISDLAKTTSDTDTAAQASVSGVEVSVPKDASDGVQVSGGAELTIGLPFADQASTAADSQKTGVLVYDNNNGSSTVPVTHTDGTLQISTVIENASAPKRYDYPMSVPEGASLTQDANGTVAVVTADGSPLSVFGEAWAKDANGKAVPTHYEVHGNTLTQVVEFSQTTAFPVVADPSTGVYSYICILQNGSSYVIAAGTPLNNCKGSYLKKYINGAVVQSIPLTGYGYPANPKAFGTLDCYIAIGYAATSIYGPGVIVRALAGTIGYVISSGLPNITACRG
ncbi:hypothetical protein AB4Z18_00745 [Leifsonia sp. 2TAF2]|uniref:hypothetical protein n=1 Tax=Leifsonia sp. 2TAF2 TaxID=3233009 RepID=UPI003F9563FB